MHVLQLLCWKPSRKPRIPTEFEYDKKPGREVCAVSPNNRLFVLLQTANCKTCYDEVTCAMLVFAKIRSQLAPLSCLAAEIGSRTRVRNCVRFQNRGNSCRASLEIRYSLASCMPPHLARTMEFRASHWRNFSQRERKRDSEDAPFCGTSFYCEASRYFIEGIGNGVMGSQVCHDAEKKMLCSTSNVVYLIKIRFAKPKSRCCLVNIFLAY